MSELLVTGARRNERGSAEVLQVVEGALARLRKDDAGVENTSRVEGGFDGGERIEGRISPDSTK